MIIAGLGVSNAPVSAAAYDACNSLSPESVAAELAKNSEMKVLRVIITVRTAGAGDRAAIDQETRSFAEVLKDAGAHIASPIEGQPFVVVELDKEVLLKVATDPRVACISSDQPERGGKPHS
jgi:hypothetical protein